LSRLLLQNVYVVGDDIGPKNWLAFVYGIIDKLA